MSISLSAIVSAMTFPEKISYLMRLRGWTPRQAAEELGLASRSTVNNWAKGTSEPRVHEIAVICRVFDVSPEYLVFDEVDEPKRSFLSEDQRLVLRVYAALKISADEAVRRLVSEGGMPETGRTATGKEIASQDLTDSRRKRKSNSES